VGRKKKKKREKGTEDWQLFLRYATLAAERSRVVWGQKKNLRKKGDRKKKRKNKKQKGPALNFVPRKNWKKKGNIAVPVCLLNLTPDHLAFLNPSKLNFFREKLRQRRRTERKKRGAPERIGNTISSGNLFRTQVMRQKKKKGKKKLRSKGIVREKKKKKGE